MKTKKCSKCREEKTLCEFGKDKSRGDGHKFVCKPCEKKKRNTPQAQKAQKEQSRAYYQANKEKILKRHKVWKEENRDYLKDYHKNYVIENKEHKRAYDEAYRQANKEKIREKNRSYQKRRRANDPAYNLKCNVSTHVYVALKNQGSTKGGSTFSALPYTPSDLVEHLEKQFDETMTWDNYGSYWDVDHIHPQSLLPYTSLEDENFQKCWALNNLQPLEKMANIRKGNKVVST
jgi:hypothetical protein